MVLCGGVSPSKAVITQRPRVPKLVSLTAPPYTNLQENNFNKLIYIFHDHFLLHI